MSEVISQKSGGFKYIKGVFQYSGGVAALPGCEIERCAFLRILWCSKTDLRRSKLISKVLIGRSMHFALANFAHRMLLPKKVLRTSITNMLGPWKNGAFCMRAIIRLLAQMFVLNPINLRSRAFTLSVTPFLQHTKIKAV